MPKTHLGMAIISDLILLAVFSTLPNIAENACIKFTEPFTSRTRTLACGGDRWSNIVFYRWMNSWADVQEITHINQVNGSNLKIVVHGLTGSAEDWTKPPHNDLIKGLQVACPHSDILVVDWHSAAAPWGGRTSALQFKNVYKQPALNVRDVGAIIAQFLESPGSRIDIETTHCIGFSLGGIMSSCFGIGHVCGFIGKSLTKGKRLGRITGLDPARPGFDSPLPRDRLDETDADFVDVIHTSTLGLLRAVGHVDFYFNDPTKQQPHCLPYSKDLPRIFRRQRRWTVLGIQLPGWRDFTSSVHNIIDDTRELANANICSHYAAIELFAASCNRKCELKACACLSFSATLHDELFKQSLASEKCIIDGVWCSSRSVTFGIFARKNVTKLEAGERYYLGMTQWLV